MKVSVHWLRDFVALKPPIERLADHLTLAGLEVKSVDALQSPKDFIFEVEVTTNRPDWLSHIGVAREIAAVESLPLKSPKIDSSDSRKLPPGWRLELRDPEGCPYYSGILLEGVTLGATPLFMKERLEACGLRSINLAVDITNYVLLETGQPLHAFDADTLRGKAVVVRRAKPGEKILSIDGKERLLEVSDLVIADQEKAVAVAGVMGGKDTEVGEKTHNIFLESAFFNPRSIRRTSQRLGLVSESSYRFERKVDPAGVDYARQRALYLFQEYAKPRFVSTVLKKGQKPALIAARIHLTSQEIQKTLGAEIKPHLVSAILTRLGLSVRQKKTGSWFVTVPSFRPDLTRPVDLIEEVARIYGYDNIPASLPARMPIESPLSLMSRVEERTLAFFQSAGMHETVTFSFISSKGFAAEASLGENVVIRNPYHYDFRWLRHHMLPSLLPVIQRNFDHGAEGVSVFEIAHLYRAAKGKKPEEEKTVACALAGMFRKKNWLDSERKANFFDLKGTVEAYLAHLGIREAEFDAACTDSCLAPGKRENIVVRGETVGSLGEIAPELYDIWKIESEVFFAQLSLEKLARYFEARVSLRPIPRFPAVNRDLAVVVPESVKSGEIAGQIRELDPELIKAVTVFDIFRGGRIPAGHKSLAFRVTYQSAERTLVSEEIQKRHAEIADEIVRKFQATFQPSGDS